VLQRVRARETECVGERERERERERGRERDEPGDSFFLSKEKFIDFLWNIC